ncbi:hypothetical protein GOBAR_DD35381 [Gossypium barbadense]|nr:hypothetical protein GOBAR_DD35381 [Gossypium barbadense]
MSIDYSSDDSSCYPKTSYWNESTNCCSWKGVNCDKASGQVFGLDLSCSLLVGSLSPNTSPFRLQGLKRLNLASNDFNASPIQSGFIPSDISLPAKLISLDLSQNNHLKFDSHSLAMLTRNLSKLQNLFLNSVNMFDVVPTSFNNLPSSLKRLRLEFCDLKGEFPSEIFQLAYLEHVDLSWNSLTGYLPKSNWSSTLKYFKLYNNHFGGSIPASIGNLTKITFLDLSLNEFEGQLPSILFILKQLPSASLPTHVTGLQNLNEFFLNDNSLTGGITSWPFTLPSLKYLDLSNNSLTGPIDKIQKPNSVQEGPLLAPLPPSLEEFWISNNNFTGEIPPPICNLTFPQILDLSKNYLGGIILKCLGSSSYGSRIINLQKNIFKGKIPDFCADYNVVRDQEDAALLLYVLARNSMFLEFIFVSSDLKKGFKVDLEDNLHSFLFNLIIRVFAFVN